MEIQGACTPSPTPQRKKKPLNASSYSLITVEVIVKENIKMVHEWEKFFIRLDIAYNNYST